MANCPKCGKELKLWNVRAECPSCGVNIPNYNWEQRLNDDADVAEKSFARLHYKFHNFGSATVGSTLRIIRLICTFLPLIALVLPLANLTVNLPFYSSQGTVSFLSIVLKIVDDTSVIGLLMALTKGEILGTISTNLLISIAGMVLAVVFGVLNFFVLLISALNLRWVFNVILNVLATASFAVSYYFMNAFFVANEGTSLTAVSGSVSYAYILGIALFALNMVLNIVVGAGLKKQKATQPTIEQATEEEIGNLHAKGYGYKEEEKKAAKKQKKAAKAK